MASETKWLLLPIPHGAALAFPAACVVCHSPPHEFYNIAVRGGGANQTEIAAASVPICKKCRRSIFFRSLKNVSICSALALGIGTVVAAIGLALFAPHLLREENTGVFLRYSGFLGLPVAFIAWFHIRDRVVGRDDARVYESVTLIPTANFGLFQSAAVAFVNKGYALAYAQLYSRWIRNYREPWLHPSPFEQGGTAISVADLAHSVAHCVRVWSEDGAASAVAKEVVARTDQTGPMF